MKLSSSVAGIKSGEADDALHALMKEAVNLRASLDEDAIVTITDRQRRITFMNAKFCAI